MSLAPPTMNNLKEEWIKYARKYTHGRELCLEDSEVADWWIQKLEEREGEILKQIEGMKREIEDSFDQYDPADAWDDGYNRACKDIKALFTKH